MDVGQETLWSIEPAVDKSRVENQLGPLVSDLRLPPVLDLELHRLEVALDTVHSNRKCIDQVKALRVFGEHRCEVPGKRHVRTHEHSVATGHRQPHALVMRVAHTDRKAATFHFGCEIEDSEHLHA